MFRTVVEMADNKLKFGISSLQQVSEAQTKPSLIEFMRKDP